MEALLAESEEIFKFEEVMHLLQYQLITFAFYDSVSLDLATRLLVHYETQMTDAGSSVCPTNVRNMLSIFKFFLI